MSTSMYGTNMEKLIGDKYLTSLGNQYTKQAISTGGTEIDLYQPSDDRSDAVPDRIEIIVPQAQRWVSWTLQKTLECFCARQVSQYFGNAFRYCFGPDPPDPNDKQFVPQYQQYLEEVYYVLSLISHGLCRGHLIILVEQKDRGGGVQGIVVGRGVEAHFEAQGPIKISRKRIWQGERATKTMIHEAGHVFAKLIDSAYADWPPDHDDVGWLKGLGWSEPPKDVRSKDKGPRLKDPMKWLNAKINADSYAMFAYYLSKMDQSA